MRVCRSAAVREFFAESCKRPREDEQGGQQREGCLEVVEAAQVLFWPLR